MTKIEGNGRKFRHIVSSVKFSNSVHVGHPFFHLLNLSFVVWNVHTVLVNGGHVQYCTVYSYLIGPNYMYRIRSFLCAGVIKQGRTFFQKLTLCISFVIMYTVPETMNDFHTWKESSKHFRCQHGNVSLIFLYWPANIFLTWKEQVHL